MNLRNFLTLLGAASVAAVLPVVPVSLVSDSGKSYQSPPNDWPEFLERVQRKVSAIVAREGRGLRRPIDIGVPRVSEDGTFFTRRVQVHLEAGGSLLQKVYFEFDEVSGSRMVDWGV